MPVYNRIILLLLLISGMVTISGYCENRKPTNLKLFDLHRGKVMTGPEVMDSMKGFRLILVGEQHTNDNHHDKQLRVIRFFNQHALPIAIGLEMFRKNQQEALNRWVEGKIDETTFKSVYLENWNFPWRHYKGIFIFARDNRIPMGFIMPLQNKKSGAVLPIGFKNGGITPDMLISQQEIRSFKYSRSSFRYCPSGRRSGPWQLSDSQPAARRIFL